MRFQKTTSYALQILSYMARDASKRMSASYLHKKLKIPYSYLRQVLSDLSRSGFINGLKGRNGGFVLRNDSGMIRLADIVEATEGLDSINKCIMAFSKCPFNEKCVLHPVWDISRANIIKTLEKTSLADLLTKTK